MKIFITMESYMTALDKNVQSTHTQIERSKYEKSVLQPSEYKFHEGSSHFWHRQ